MVVKHLELNDFFTWGTLASFSGATVAVAVLTQFFKGLFDKLPFHVPTRAVSYVFSLAVLILSSHFTNGGTAGTYILCFINAALVSLASNGAHDLVRSVFPGGINDKNNT